MLLAKGSCFECKAGTFQDLVSCCLLVTVQLDSKAFLSATCTALWGSAVFRPGKPDVDCSVAIVTTRRPCPARPRQNTRFQVVRTLSDTATTARPVGSDRAFWEPVTAMSTFHLSIWKSKAPMEDTPSTMNKAGCWQASMVSRILARSLVTPVAVSLWTTATALIFLSVSAFNACRFTLQCI